MNKINKILIISAHFYPLKGGTPTHTENLCTELSNLGYDVHLVTEDNFSDDMEKYDTSQNFKIYRLKAKKIFRGDLFFPLLIGLRINKYVKKIQPDVINISTGNYVPLGIKLSKKQNVPIVYTVHNVPPEEYTFNICRNNSLNDAVKEIYFWIIKRVMTNCIRYGRYDEIISVSDTTKTKLIGVGAEESNINIVPNGVSTPIIIDTNFDKMSEYYNILVTAGIIEHKGQLDLVLAMPLIRKKIPNVRCILVGPIRSQAYLSEIKNSISSLGLDDSVLITGEVSQEVLERYFSICNLYIQPSYQEGFCIAIMEAMIRGKAVIGTNVGAIPKLLADNRGIVINEPNSNLIYHAVCDMYDNKNNCCHNSIEYGKRYIKKEFEWTTVAEKTVDVYLKAVTDYPLL